MRPIRFLLLLSFFVILPVFLTCISLFSGRSQSATPLGAGIPTRTSRLRALFSFTTPSSLFPPSAIISLTDDNSTFFVARPAAFGPGLPESGLSGQLWIGKGFGDGAFLSDDELRVSGFELGCSDVPGWENDPRWRPENGAADVKTKNTIEQDGKFEGQSKTPLPKRDEQALDGDSDPIATDDGTDDHLHSPLPDSNPATSAKPGEPARSNDDKSRPPTHADIESLQESADIAGKIVMLTRGGCGFLEKVKWAQRRGGIALIVGDNEPRPILTVMYAKGDTSNVTIPAIFTSYNAAHLLSSLIPAGSEGETSADGKGATPNTSPDSTRGAKGKSRKEGGPVFTSTKVKDSQQTRAVANSDKHFMQDVLAAVGLKDSSDSPNDDSRRPPSSGNIDWVLLEDWDEDKPEPTTSVAVVQATTKAIKPTTKAGKARVTSTHRHENDDFVIGIQDWRDTELIAPKPTTATIPDKQHGSNGEVAAQQTTATTTADGSAETALKGGSITPGSGEYDHAKHVKGGRHGRKDSAHRSRNRKPIATTELSFSEKLWAFFGCGHRKEIVHPHPEDIARAQHSDGDDQHEHQQGHIPKEREGLWVTLTPTDVSASPFFDTLLVLVVSPLVTLTFVYGLLLLRSRIRRRRWRAPKSVVERLPVRTYHTMNTTSSTTSSQLSSPNRSSTTSPQLRPTSHRPRSQTTAGVLSSPPEKDSPGPVNRRRKYTGRQIECVVCLEEYVDGESRVMSLPCGHEFHVDCITPWLVTRRRTCPICKGDVVRSMNRSGSSSQSEEDLRHSDEQTSDDVQDRAAETVNESATAAIPIPVHDDDLSEDDLERGDVGRIPLLNEQRSPQQHRGWRGILNASISRLSGDTVWNSTPQDRSR